MNEKADRILAKHEAVLQNGAADMWRIALADTVLIMLNEGAEITRDTLLTRIAGQMDATENKIVRANLMGTINVLNGRLPRD